MTGWNEAAWYTILAGVAIKGTAVLACAWFTTRLLRGRSAAARHLVWTAAAMAALVLPLLSMWLPGWAAPTGVGILRAPASVVFRSTAAAAPGVTALRSAPHGGAAAPFQGGPGRWDWRLAWMPLWAAGTALVLAQMLAACAAVRRVRRAARPFSGGDLCGALSRELEIRERVEVLEAEAGSMPMTFGVLRSFILMPSTAVEWSAERRRAVLLHELAHVRRRDAATHLLARTALELYWWNPLAWLAWRGFLRERERAADDLVLNAGARASEYAGHLLDGYTDILKARVVYEA